MYLTVEIFDSPDKRGCANCIFMCAFAGCGLPRKASCRAFPGQGYRYKEQQPSAYIFGKVEHVHHISAD